MSFNLKIWRYRYGLTQQQTAWLLSLSVADIRRLDAGVGQLEEGDIAWLQEYARFRDQAREVPEVQVRIGRWHFLVAQVTGTVRPADAAAAQALRGAGRRRLERSAVEFALNFRHAQPGIGWLWLHADGRPTRRNPAFPPCWRVVRPTDTSTWIGWPACAHVDHFCPDANRPRSDRRVRS
jgi:hypothetical protein